VRPWDFHQSSTLSGTFCDQAFCATGNRAAAISITAQAHAVDFLVIFIMVTPTFCDVSLRVAKHDKPGPDRSPRKKLIFLA